MSHWHLHATVTPHWSWNLSDTASALSNDIKQLGAKLVHVVNILRDGSKRPELIPTQHYEGTEMQAVSQLFKLGHILENKGWQVQRLKIEGDLRHVDIGRVIYWESHCRITPEEVPFFNGRAVSITKKNTLVTIRRRELPHLMETLHSLSLAVTNVGACVLDTNEESDAGWIS